MEIIALIASTASLAGVIAAVLLLRGFLPAYMAEKGKNAASREDLAHLTELVERIKAQHGADIERLKSDLLAEGQVAERRRRIYEEMCASLRMFMTGYAVTPEARERFNAGYAAAWLWASDAVPTALNEFVQFQVQLTASPGSIEQPVLKRAYTNIVVAMRKDVGFPQTALTGAHFQFVYF